MPKIYFIVGAIGTGVIRTATDLTNSYKNEGFRTTLRTIGRFESIENAGTREPAQTLEKIKDLILEDAGRSAVVFMGWRIPDHINEIYETYKDSATFIFTEGKDDSDRAELNPNVSSEKIDEIIADENKNISNFISKNAFSLNYQTVASPIFGENRNLNLSNTSSIKIAILGSM